MPEGEEMESSAAAFGKRWIRADVVLLAIAIAVLTWFIGPVLLMDFAGVLLAVARQRHLAPTAS